MDPLVGVLGALVIASWSAALIRDTGAVLLDMTPDRRMAETLRARSNGRRWIADLHLWRLGPGHLGAIVSVVTPPGGEADYPRSSPAFLAVASDHRGPPRRRE